MPNVEAVKATEYLRFWEEPTPVSRKTGIWTVRSKRTNGLLGHIEWYGAWRQYCFFPASNTIFNRGCLEDINEFITERMEERK